MFPYEYKLKQTFINYLLLVATSLSFNRVVPTIFDELIMCSLYFLEQKQKTLEETESKYLCKPEPDEEKLQFLQESTPPSQLIS